MDNPNDFIHIDEVFRRMKDREEPEPSGAWMRMKDLLDKEMPAASPVAAAGSSLRRYMIPLAALLLLGTGAAWYNLKGNKTAADRPEAISGNSGMERPAAFHTGTTPPATAPADKVTGNAKSNPRSGAPATGNTNGRPESTHPSFTSGNATATASKATTSGHKPGNHIPAGAASHTGRPGTASSAQSAAGKPQSPKEVNTPAAYLAAANGSNDNNKIPAGNTASQERAKNAVAGSNAVRPPVAGKGAASAGSHQPAKPFEQQHVLEDLYPSTAAVTGLSGANNSKGGTKPDASGNNNVPGMKVVASNWNDNKIVKDELGGGYYKEVRDTFKKIEMVERLAVKDASGESKGLSKVVDTLTITRVERIRFTPLEPVEMAALRKAKIIPMAHPAVIPAAKVREYTVANEMVNLVPLANYKVASRRMDPSKFNQIVQNTTQGISNYFDGTNKFYAAILLGGNAFAGNPGAFGMQFGIAGLYQLNERLTLGAEIRFANHYFSNYTINDQSVSYDNISSQQVSGVQWLFSGTQTTSTAAYRVNSFAALEFPVTLSYSLGRVSVFGGANLMYAFPVKWEKTNTVSIQDVSSTVNQDKNPFVTSGPSMNEQQDFASRMGLGYVAGVSYDVSRKISLDARMTQNLWTSYNGNARAVNDLFGVPTFQFSIGYFFGRKERVVYIMDRK